MSLIGEKSPWGQRRFSGWVFLGASTCVRGWRAPPELCTYCVCRCPSYLVVFGLGNTISGPWGQSGVQGWATNCGRTLLLPATQLPQRVSASQAHGHEGDEFWVPCLVWCFPPAVSVSPTHGGASPVQGHKKPSLPIFAQLTHCGGSPLPCTSPRPPPAPRPSVGRAVSGSRGGVALCTGLLVVTGRWGWRVSGPARKERTSLAAYCQWGSFLISPLTGGAGLDWRDSPST